jgi:hypothetical protein
MSDPFGHRKYHSLYFILGFLIAVVLVLTLSGCERGKDSKGRACSAIAGMTWEGEACEVDDYPPTWPEPPSWDDPPVYCCMALTPSCEACQEGIPEDVWLENTCGIDAIDAEYYGWDEDLNEPIWLCQAVIID